MHAFANPVGGSYFHTRGHPPPFSPSSSSSSVLAFREGGRAMGFRERFLTAGVAIPLALWVIVFDSRLCLALVLVLQAISVQELSGLLHRTRRVPADAQRRAMPPQGRSCRRLSSLFCPPTMRSRGHPVQLCYSNTANWLDVVESGRLHELTELSIIQQLHTHKEQSRLKTTM